MSEPAAPAPLTLADRIVAWFDPVRGLRRAHARKVMAYYEAARPSRLRKGRRETKTANEAVLQAGSAPRQIARHLDENYDLAVGVLNALVNNVVGPKGIGIEPQPRRADGSIDDALARQILELWRRWTRQPEVTRQHDWASAQRLMCRTWLRDGEVFAQHVLGTGRAIQHGSAVPYSLEMLEAEYVPQHMASMAPLIQQGIELNDWGAPVAYHVFRVNPLEGGSSVVASGMTKRVPAAAMIHLKHVIRIRQLRGMSIFASVLDRFDDLKDYEESERIAAKIAASMAAFIKKGTPDAYDPNESAQRELQFRPGMIFDDLRPGEEIGTIDTSRPNVNLETYRNGQLKAIAAGTGPTFSSIAKTYDGTYSAQRQELVEGWGSYGTLADEFVSRVVQPVYENFIAMAVASGQLRVPDGVLAETVDDAAYMPPAMPWIDPMKEAEAYAILEDRVYASGPEIVRRRGGNPIATLEQQSRWLREKAAAGIPPPRAAGASSAAAGQTPAQDPVQPSP